MPTMSTASGGAPNVMQSCRAESVGASRLREQAVCGRPDAVVEHLAQVAETGADTVYFHLFDVDDLDHLRLLGAEVLPRLTPSGFR